MVGYTDGMKSLLAIALAGVAMTPCLWDSDTLDTELRGLPEAFDLIVGKWHRHSDAYYEDRVAKLTDKAALTLVDFDDLAVAYEHLDKRDKAIEVMADKAMVLAAKPASAAAAATQRSKAKPKPPTRSATS